MTVAELISELSKLPQDVPVRVEGYFPDTPNQEGASASFNPNHVEALKNEETGVLAIIWAQAVTEDDPLRL